MGVQNIGHYGSGVRKLHSGKGETVASRKGTEIIDPLEINVQVDIVFKRIFGHEDSKGYIGCVVDGYFGC
jgi:hypothetical protein